MLVYVLNKHGKPLMPCKPAKARLLLKKHKAKVIKREPFVIQLLYGSSGYKQPVSLGIDAGSRYVGLSAITEKRELFSAEAELRDDINKKLEAKRSARRSRRNRKTRYRKARFNNRGNAKTKGHLMPSVKAKCDSHITLVKKVLSILPVSEIHIEMASFDTQLLKAQTKGKPIPSGEDYQHGESNGFDNIKAYVKWRDGYQCQICGAKGMLQVHHKVQRKDGGTNTPSNLITVCPECHKKYHTGLMSEKEAQKMRPNSKTHSYRDASFMGIMRWAVWNRLNEFGLPCHMTFGYLTARTRKDYGIEKSHHADARCISGNPTAVPLDYWYRLKKVRCHNRQIHKFNISKGGVRKSNQASFEVKGFRLFDKVRAKGREWYIHGRRVKGAFVLKDLCDNKLEIVPSKVKFVRHQNGYLIERIRCSSPD